MTKEVEERFCLEARAEQRSSPPVPGEEEIARAFYMGMYGPDGAKWSANLSRDIWFAGARAVLKLFPAPLQEASPAAEIAACAKCGWGEATVRYNAPVDKDTAYFERREREEAGIAGEHLRCICKRCRYEWTQPCAPSPAADAVVEALRKLDELDAKRTKGPWSADEPRKGYALTVRGAESDVPVLKAPDYARKQGNDIAFIVALENAWPLLRAALTGSTSLQGGEDAVVALEEREPQPEQCNDCQGEGALEIPDPQRDDPYYCRVEKCTTCSGSGWVIP